MKYCSALTKLLAHKMSFQNHSCCNILKMYSGMLALSEMLHEKSVQGTVINYIGDFTYRE